MTETEQELIDTLADVVEAADRMLALMGKGRAPSPRLQEAFDRARRLLPNLPPQQAPRP
jgi:hypothetical protein